MTLRIGWLTPFNNRTGVGTFSKAITDAMPEVFDGEPLDLTIIAPIVAGLYTTRHRVVDVNSASPTSRFYDTFDILVYNVGNNEEHHQQIFEVLKNFPGIIICHDYVYQHFIAKMVSDRQSGFADYIALLAQYGSPESLRRARQSNITKANGLFYAMWDSDFSAVEPLGAPIFHLGSALIVHSAYAKAYADSHFSGPILQLGMPHDQREAKLESRDFATHGSRRTVVSFGHVQETKCIEDIIFAISSEPRLRSGIDYVISGFSGETAYLYRLRSVVRQCGLQDNIRFALNLTDQQLTRLSHKADAFINLRFPNTEGASVSLIEQLTTAKPVVVFDTGCYAEVPDNAVIKVGPPRNISAIANGMLRLLDDGEDLIAIGSRGRKFAMRENCGSYVNGLLKLIDAERGNLRQRAKYQSICDIDFQCWSDEDSINDPKWARKLEIARSNFDLIDQGRLASSLTGVRDLNVDKAVDFVLAAIFRESANRRLYDALRAYLSRSTDIYESIAVLQYVHTALVGHSLENCARLPEIIPQSDLSFWSTIAAWDRCELINALGYGFFGEKISHETDSTQDIALDGILSRIRLAETLSNMDLTRLKSTSENFETVIAWLKDSSGWEAGNSVQQIRVGQTIKMGADDQTRFVRMIGFYDPDTSHAWTGPDLAMIYLHPGPGVRRILILGHLHHEDTSIDIAAVTQSGLRLARQTHHDDWAAFEIVLTEESPESCSPPICVHLRSAGCSSPLSLGRSPDPRPLGFSLQKIVVG